MKVQDFVKSLQQGGWCYVKLVVIIECACKCMASSTVHRQEVLDTAHYRSLSD